jgi:16S rRNA (uracil1498-N3)-methyltransferase
MQEGNMVLRRFFLETGDSAGQRAVLTGEQARHAARVLRLGPGELVGLFDKNGLEFRARILAVSPELVELEILERCGREDAVHVRIALAQGFLKSPKMDKLIPAVTELGAEDFLAFFCRRSVPRPAGVPREKVLARWEKIGRESAKQCGRSDAPKCAILSFDELVSASARYDARILFWEREPELFPPAAAFSGKPQKVLVAVGPEGGFAEEEARSLSLAGFVSAGLGPLILRAETAAVSALALAGFFFGKWEKNLDNPKIIP